MALRRATGPDGREWEIRVVRVRLRWHESRFDPWEYTNDLLSGLVAFLVLAPLFWLVLPLIRVIVFVPFEFVASAFSSTRWIEAESHWPSELKMVWKTSRARAAAAADQIATALSQGYGGLDPEGAELESITKPPGIDDLSA